ncbi:MAG: transcription termination/antitermination NusG family protein [Planctomycetota bacterium]
MPILPPEPDLFPDDLLTCEELLEQANVDASWYSAYTKSRQEKLLMRHLRQLEVPHYGPLIPKRSRSPAGRVRSSLVPLFSNYVFLLADEMQRYNAICTGCIMKATPVVDHVELVQDLRQIQSLISMDAPMTIESRIEPGQRVRVRNGSFAGYEGIAVRRDAETCLIVSVRFMEQGVSVKLDDCQLEKI